MTGLSRRAIMLRDESRPAGHTLERNSNPRNKALFDWAGLAYETKGLQPVERMTACPQVGKPRPFGKPRMVLLKRKPRSRISKLSHRQFSLSYAPDCTRFVAKNKHHILSYRTLTYFTRGHARFIRVGFELEDDGVWFVGDLVKLTEDDFREYTKSKTITAYVKAKLHRNGLGFGMATPKWDRPAPSRFSR
jgi:hypothetical protein